MNKALILFLLPLMLLGCAHDEFKAYLMDENTKKHGKSVQKNALPELNVALSYAKKKEKADKKKDLEEFNAALKEAKKKIEADQKKDRKELSAALVVKNAPVSDNPVMKT